MVKENKIPSIAAVVNMNFKIGVFGSADSSSEKYKNTAYKVGKLLAEENCILITGATTGLPGIAQAACHKAGGLVWGFSPACDKNQHLERTPDDDLSNYTKLIYIPKDYEHINNAHICRKYRNVSSTATCDGGIIISGR